MSNLEGEESFDTSMLGQAEEVVQERISDDELIMIKGLVVKLSKLHVYKQPFCLCYLEPSNVETSSRGIAKDNHWL